MNVPSKTKSFNIVVPYPYQSIDSGLFYEKIIKKLTQNKNISFYKSIKEVSVNNSFIFNSVPSQKFDNDNLWQHFCGVEIETQNKTFLMIVFSI